LHKYIIETQITHPYYDPLHRTDEQKNTLHDRCVFNSMAWHVLEEIWSVICKVLTDLDME